MNQDLPRWLTEQSLEELLGWAPWMDTTMSRVVAAYEFGLHDSYWAELRLDTARSGQALLVFRFCADWIRLPPSPSDWPLLLVRVPEVRSVALENYRECHDQFGHWEWREIEDAQTTVDVRGVTETRITGFYGETVVLRHAEEVSALCVWESGDVIELPELAR